MSQTVASPKLYFVKVDVKSAFDSIKLDKLFEVLGEVFNTVRRRCCSKTSVLTHIRTNNSSCEDTFASCQVLEGNQKNTARLPIHDVCHLT